MVIDYRGRCDGEGHPTSQREQELLPAAAQHPQTRSPSQHVPRALQEPPVPAGPGAGGCAHGGERGAHTRSEPSSAPGLGRMFQFAPGRGARREPFPSSPPIRTHLVVPTTLPGLAATDGLSGCEVMLRDLPSPTYA